MHSKKISLSLSRLGGCLDRYCTNFVICVMQLGIGSVLIVFMAVHIQEVRE